MEISFILSADEIFTLISMMLNRTKSGTEFLENALRGAKLCDLSGLINKKLAHIDGDELELEPVIRMVIDSISNADIAEDHGNYWEIHSAWINLHCEIYPFKADYWKITPVKGAVA